MKIALVLIGLALAACIHTTPMHGPDGQRYTHISCSGGFDSTSDCYRKANEVCPQGYLLAGQQQYGVPVSFSNVTAYQNSVQGQLQGNTLGMMDNTREILVQCK